MNRVLLIGLDGAEPSLVERWMAEGRLPALARLRDRGGYLPLRSTIPPATFPSWTSCVTGVNPGRHGIIDFTRMAPGSYAVEFINATYRKADALWNTLSRAGKRVVVLGVPGTYPPDEVNGVMVAGFDSPVATNVDPSFVYPPSAYNAVKDWRFADFQESDVGPGWHDEALRLLLDKAAVKERIALDLMRSEPWDFFMVVFSESDTVAHHFWLFHDPGSPRHRPGPADAIRRVYERLDEAVGALVAAAGDNVTVMVCSDHGFGGAGTGVVHLNNRLAETGCLQFTPAHDSLLKRLALSVVPQQWRGGLFRRFTGLASRAESRSRFAGIDWRNTTAFSEELNYFPSVRVNLQGREPLGQVPPDEYETFRDRLCRELEAWGPVAKAHRREDVISGPCVDRAPDVILELALEDGYSHSCLRGRAGPSFRRIGEDEYYGGKERGMTGNHRPTGVLFLSEPTPSGGACMEDIAPTVLSRMGVAGPPMDGTSLFDPAAVDADAPEPTERGEQPYSPEQEQAVEQRLRDLGYFE